MFGDIVGSLIGGVAGKLFGGDGNSDNVEAQERMAARNEALQREFAQTGIRWRVADAQAAGIHPLFALGASIPSASPSHFIPGDSGRSDDVSFYRGLGQDIGRAVSAGSTQSERHARRMSELAMDRSELENAILRARLAKETGSQISPAIPEVTGPTSIPGQPDASVVVKPVEVPTTQQGVPSQQAGAGPDNKWVKTNDGWLAMPSEWLKLDDMDITNPEYVNWWLRNRFLPAVPWRGRDLQPPPMEWLPPGAKGWVYRGGQYKPVYDWSQVEWWENSRGRPNIKGEWR